MKQLIGMSLMIVGVSQVAMAAPLFVPEIDGGSAASVLALVSGAVLFMKARKK